MKVNNYLMIGEKLFLPKMHDLCGCSYFEVIDIFTGGMGVCYKIVDNNKNPFALKMIHSDLWVDENSYRRYIDECQKWLSFSTCNGILEAICVVQVNDIPCVISKWMEGGDMSSVIKRLNIDEFYTYMNRIVITLKWVYDNFKVIHRDLKPANILIGDKNEAYVGDWGLAKIISNADINNLPKSLSADINDTHGFVGTILYASPEQIMGKKDIDFRSDIYSLGCIMYEWETGVPPFVGKTIQHIASSHVYSAPKKIGGFFRRTNFKAESLIMKCLEKDPLKRFQTYDELIAELQKLATRHCKNFVPFIVREKFAPVNIGCAEFIRKLQSKSFDAIYAIDEKGALLRHEDIQPYLLEAETLIGLERYEEAIVILKGFYIDSIVRKSPDMGFHQFLGNNLAYCYNKLNRTAESLEVLDALSTAKSKHIGYYVNLSNSYIITEEFSKALQICDEALEIHPREADLMGNRTIALSRMGRLNEALINANKRLELSRDIHALCEAGLVCYDYAEQNKNLDFPKAIEKYKMALLLYREAEKLNPKYKSATYNIANLLFKLRRYRDSINQCIRIMEMENGVAELSAYYYIRNLCWLGEGQKALENCDKWLKQKPNSVWLQRIKSEVLTDYFSIGKTDKDGNRIVSEFSLRFFERICSTNKDVLPSDFVFFARTLFWMDDIDEVNKAFSVLEYATKKYPNYWTYDYIMASQALYYDLEGVLEFALRAQRKAPWREKTYELLIDAYKREGGDNAQQNILRCQKKYEEIKKQKEILYASCSKI